MTEISFFVATDIFHSSALTCRVSSVTQCVHKVPIHLGGSYKTDNCTNIRKWIPLRSLKFHLRA
jgi:hypothetical protein